MNRQDELIHYGVPGMKWGHHKSTYQTYGQVKTARNDLKVAKRAERKAFNTMYNRAANHPISNNFTKNGVRKMERATSDWQHSSKNLANKKQAYKDAKTAFKEEKVARTKEAVKDYNKKFKTANLLQEHADKSAREMKEKYAALGKK